ncbi:hypothetical protein [Tissierella simiarum]|nr:hypothetical protein [Tissierella simiarum]
MKCRKPIVTISADLYQRAGAFLFKHEWIPDYIAVPVLDFLDGVV